MMPSFDRRDVLKVVAAAPLMGFASPAMHEPAASSIAAAAAKAGRQYGTAVRADRLFADATMQAAVVADCRWITPEFDWNWDALQPRADCWWFERGDALLAFAQAHGKVLRGHSLLWDQSTPAWAKAAMAERPDWGLVERWFAAALGRYGAAAQEWDVVNEAIDTEGGEAGLRRTCFQRTFGSGYVARALHAARALAPGAALFINDYGLDYANPVERARRTALVRRAEALLREGAPLNGIGVQAHLDLAKGPLDTRGITAMLRAFAGMGLTVTITELDVMEADRALPIGARDSAIADEVRRYLDVVLAEPVVRGVTSWGVSDRDSWLAAGNRGLLRDAAFRPKPAYWAARDAFAGARRLA